MSVGDSKVRVAKGLQFRGRVDEAEAIYREVLRDEPGDAEALEGLGVLVFQLGRAAEAADLFAREWQSARIRPAFKPTWAKPCARSTGSTRPSRIFAGQRSSTRVCRMRGTAWRLYPNHRADTPTPLRRAARPSGFRHG